jgi:hypothetical protein
VRGRERHVGEDVLLGAVHEGCELGHLRAELVGDGAPLPLRTLRISFCVGCADPGGNDVALRLPGMGERVAGEVHPGAVENALVV